MIKLINLKTEIIKEVYKIKRTSTKYVGLIEDVLEDYNDLYKEYSDLYSIYLDDKIIGLVVISRTPLNGKWCFTDLVIDDDYQHQGYGKLATNKIIEHFKNRNESNVIKIEVFNENINAIKCYEKCGFKITKQCDWNHSFIEMEFKL